MTTERRETRLGTVSEHTPPVFVRDTTLPLQGLDIRELCRVFGARESCDDEIKDRLRARRCLPRDDARSGPACLRKVVRVELCGLGSWESARVLGRPESRKLIAPAERETFRAALPIVQPGSLAKQAVDFHI